MALTSKPSPNRAKRIGDIQHWDIETDVIVVGFGGAGACAAIEASTNGADVHIMELASAAGGSTAMSGGEVYLGGSGGTALQKKFGFEDSTENFFNYLMMQHAPQADEAKVRAYAEGAAKHFDWLVDKGVPFKETYLEERVVEPMTDDGLFWCGNEKAWPEIESCKPVPRGHVVQLEGMGAGAVLMETLQRHIDTLPVTQHFDTRALSLIVNDEVEVVGLVVRKDGELLACKARKGVILCAGGFVMNDDMLAQYAPRLSKATEKIGNPGDMGMGIQMGISVGAAAINMHEGFNSIPFYPPGSLTYGILVNDKGQRFINEDTYHGRVGTAVLEQNSQRFYMIADVDAYGTYEQLNFASADVAGTGESAEELEKELGLLPNSLTHTLETYNNYAKSGQDPLFHKQEAWVRPLEPPYVALDFTPGRGVFIPYFTLGGLDSLPTGEVLRPDGSVVPGLYAAGRTACGVPRRGAGYNSGISVGDATFTGRQAGTAAAQRG